MAACTSLLLASCGGSGGGDDTGTAKPAAAETSQDGRATKLAALPSASAIPADASTRGMFGELQNWPLIPLHVVLTPSGQVLSYGTNADGYQTGKFIYDVWDSTAETGGHTTLANGTGTDLFCSSQLLLPGGDTISIVGGDNWTGTATTNLGNNNSNVYTVSTKALVRGANMLRARWYATSTTLLNGETFIQGGSGGEDYPEIRSTAGGFRLMTGIDTKLVNAYYPRNFVAPDGRLFGFDAAGLMYYITTTGVGTINYVGQFTAAVAGPDSTAAMYAPGKIIQFGGNSRGAILIDINGATPSVSNAAALTYQRRLGTATVLPDGKVLASGGSSIYNTLELNQDGQPTGSIVARQVEIWNPTTGTWTLGATGVKSRLYHNVGLLLPDATVLVGGGGAPGPENNTNVEIYYPPYLFTADAKFATRPVITSTPTATSPGRTIQVGFTSARPISRVTFIPTGAQTHGWNQSQRFVELPFTQSGTTLNVQLPSKAATVPPGVWMLFVLDDQGVPSVAKMVRVNVVTAVDTSVTPVITAVANQASTTATAVSLAVTASDPNGDTLTYSASGLPPGLAINAATGRITDTPTAIGTYSVTVAASDGFNSASSSFTWTVTLAGSAPLVLNTPTAPTQNVVGTTATFTATATGTGITYSWDFGDGSAPTARSASGTATHTYSKPGLWYATVTAYSTSGAQQSQTVAVQTYRAPTATAPAISGAMAWETRSGTLTPRVWTVNPDSNSVHVGDNIAGGTLGEINVGQQPAAVAIAPNGNVWVTNKRGNSITIINPTTLAVITTIGMPAGSQPHGIVMSRTTGTALVALEAKGQLAKVNTTSYALTGFVDVGPNPRHLSLAADGTTAYVSRFITKPLPDESTANPKTTLNGMPVGGEVVVVDTAAMAVSKTIVLAHSNRPDAENQGRGIPNYLGAPVISPDGTQAWVPSKQDNILRGATRDGMALNFQNTVRAVSSRIDLATQAEDLPARIDHDNASVASAAAFDPLGVFLFVALETSREVAVIDAYRGRQVMRIDVGRAPQALLVSADRKKLFVQNFMDRTLQVLDITALTTRSATTAPPLLGIPLTTVRSLVTGTVLTGKQFFYDARDPRLARDRYLSCASCHNDGAHDGRVWDFLSSGEGLRNTINLRGRAGMGHGMLHWSNNFDEVQDFETQIRTLAGGTGLMTDALYFTGTRSAPIGLAKTGVSADLDALAAYVGSLGAMDPSPWRPDANTLSTAAAEGRALFRSLACANCHGGTAFTNSGTLNPVNVGTIKPTSGTRLYGDLNGIDIPTLRDVWATAPYLHDGSAATLEAAITAHTTLNVSAANATKLAAYLREIGSQEGPAPAPPVDGTGLLGEYFVGTTLSGTVLFNRTEAVNFNWAAGSPGGGLPVDGFSVRWSGSVTVTNPGVYRFRTISDEGVRLWVNGVQVINNWTAHVSATDTSAALTLPAGRNTIVLEYYEGTGSAAIQFQWLPPGATTYVTVPAASLNTQ